MKDFENSLKSAYNAALRRLGLSAMTRKQTEIFLLKKGYTQNVVCEVLEKLSLAGCIDDASFAANVVRSTLERNPKSKIMLSHELRLKGVDEQALSNAMLLFDDERQQEMADRLVCNYLKKYKLDSSEAIRIKISRALYRKGFEWSVINKALKGITKHD
jgi:regulatory protein